MDVAKLVSSRVSRTRLRGNRHPPRVRNSPGSLLSENDPVVAVYPVSDAAEYDCSKCRFPVSRCIGKMRAMGASYHGRSYLH